jgi:phage tail P2-like protein
MMERPYELLYTGASGLEKALVDVDGYRLSAIPAQLIVENIDPWKVQTRNLPHLAWSLGVTLWEASWSEDWKRQWLAWQGDFMSSVGTLKAIKMALAPNAYQVVDVVRPPAGFYASPDLTADEMDAWIRLMPQIRIKLERKTGIAAIDEWFCDYSWADESAVGLDDSAVLYGRVAVLRKADGSETPLEIVTETVRTLRNPAGRRSCILCRWRFRRR